MQSQFNAIPAVPPLAMNANCSTAARLHSGDMYTNAYQGHDQTNGGVVLNPAARITAQGYPMDNLRRERVFLRRIGLARTCGFQRRLGLRRRRNAELRPATAIVFTMPVSAKSALAWSTG